MKRLALFIVPLLICSASCDRDTKEEKPVVQDEPISQEDEIIIQEEVAYTLTPPKQGDVYVAGTIEGKAVLWKNGEVQYLTNGTYDAEAKSVFVSGNNVYVAGYEASGQEHTEWNGKFNRHVAKLWKNGIAQDLTDGIYEAEVYSVFVSGNDVYVAGYEASGQKYTEYNRTFNRRIAKVWKNGVAQELTDGTRSAEAYSIFVSENDVYIAGFDYDEYKIKYAKLWKNGVVNNLSDSSSSAYSVFLSGINVYVAGIECNNAIVWKNGIKQIIAERGSSIFSHYETNTVYVLEEDVYITGTHTGRIGSDAYLWVNGVEQILSDASFNSVFVSNDGNIYIAVNYIGYKSALWINGIEQVLATDLLSWVNSIFVVE